MIAPPALKERTTYLDGRGRRVHIVGCTGRLLDGLRIFWSIQGDHYTENGQMVTGQVVYGNSYVVGPFGYRQFLLSLNSARALRSEDTRPDAVAWWAGLRVKPILPGGLPR